MKGWFAKVMSGSVVAVAYHGGAVGVTNMRFYCRIPHGARLALICMESHGVLSFGICASSGRHGRRELSTVLCRTTEAASIQLSGQTIVLGPLSVHVEDELLNERPLTSMMLHALLHNEVLGELAFPGVLERRQQACQFL